MQDPVDNGVRAQGSKSYQVGGAKRCAVLNCRKSRYRARRAKNNEITFHSFPSQADLCIKWLQFCRQDKDWKPTEYFGICSDHFRKEDYQMENIKSVANKKRILFPHAVPSIFKSTPFVQNKNTNHEEDGLAQDNLVIKNESDEASWDYRDEDALLLEYRETFCRTCLNHFTDTGALIPVKSQIQNMSVYDMLVQLTAFEAEHNDAFPPNMCVQCIDKLENAFNIRQGFIEKAEFLVQMVAEQKVLDYYEKFVVDSDNSTVSAESVVDTEANDTFITESAEPLSVSIVTNHYDDPTSEDQQIEHLEENAEEFVKSEVLDETSEGEFKCTMFDQNAIEDIDKEYESIVPITEELHEAFVEYDEADIKFEVSQQLTAISEDDSKNVESNEPQLSEYENELKRPKPRARKTKTQKVKREIKKKEEQIETEALKNYPATTCYICDKHHESVVDLEQHLQEHASMLPYECNECNSAVAKDNNDSTVEARAIDKPPVMKILSQLNRHFMMHRKPLKCNNCYRRYCTPLRLKAHLSDCHDLQTSELTCEYCGKQFFRKIAFRKHVSYHRMEHSGQFKCAVCERTFGTKDALRRHEGSHRGEKKHKCMYCDKMFSTSYNRITHQRIHTGERPYKCPNCDRSFVDGSRLKTHLAWHHKLETYAQYRTSRAGSNTRSTTNPILSGSDAHCPYPDCDYTAKFYAAMYAHKRSKHTSKFQCEQCGKSFGFSNQLKTHMVTHTGEKPFECQVCGRRFGNVHRFRRHEETHMPSQTFTCTLCPKTFKHQRYLQAHIQTHNATRKFACNFCGNRYKTKGELKRHIQSRHSTVNEDEIKVETVIFEEVMIDS